MNDHSSSECQDRDSLAVFLVIILVAVKTQHRGSSHYMDMNDLKGGSSFGGLVNTAKTNPIG